MFAGPMGVIPKVRNTKRKNICNNENKKCTKVSSKQFGANGVGLRVKRRLDVVYVQHLVDYTIKLAVTFPQNFEHRQPKFSLRTTQGTHYGIEL